MGSLIINVPFRLAFGRRNSLTLCGDLRSQRQSNCPDNSRKALSAAITLHLPPKNLTLLGKMGQEGQLPCLKSATGVAFVPLQEACLITAIIIVLIKKDTAKKGFFRVCSEFQLHVFVSVCVRQRMCRCLDFQMRAQHTRAISCPTALFFLHSATFIL